MSTNNRHFPVCIKCGDRIGVYEPLWLERSGGDVITTGWLSVADDLRRDPDNAQLFHVGCLAPDHLAASKSR